MHTPIKLIPVTALADWLMKKRDDFILVDMRPKENFDSYHIPEAVNFIDDLTFYSEEKPTFILSFYFTKCLGCGKCKDI